MSDCSMMKVTNLIGKKWPLENGCIILVKVAFVQVFAKLYFGQQQLWKLAPTKIP